MKKILLTTIMVIFCVTFSGAELTRNNASDTVSDTLTELMWQDDSSAESVKKIWVEAIDYCENLSLGGYTDWRLPNQNALRSIVERRNADPALNTVFRFGDSSHYWSSTTYKSLTNNAWYIAFNQGDGSWDNKTISSSVRCVRAGR